MRIILQNKSSSLYAKSAHEWTPDAAEAIDFETVTDAEKFCLRHGLTRVRVIAQLRSWEYRIELTALAEQGAPSAWNSALGAASAMAV